VLMKRYAIHQKERVQRWMLENDSADLSHKVSAAFSNARTCEKQQQCCWPQK
jgi:hypothetical protein